MDDNWMPVDPENQFQAVKKWYKSISSGTLLPGNLMASPYSLYTDFETRLDDVYIVCFPKCGASWLQEIVWLVKNNADVKTAKKSRSDERVPFIELPPHRLATNFFEVMPSPRILKTHVNYSILPNQIIKNNCKVIYQVRNPKDVVVSFFHFAHMNNQFDYGGDFETFVDLFINDRLPYSPFFTSVKEFWNHRDDENILFLKYEDFHKNFQENVRKVAEFLNVNLSDDQFAAIEDHCAFKNMKSNPSTNYKYWDELGFRKKEGTEFMRKGVAGDWKNKFTPEINEKMDKWIEENLKGTGITFDYEL